MKFHLNSNIVEGTPEELVKYQELLEELEEEREKALSSTEEAEAPMGYTFWYIEGTQGRNHNVLKATLDGDFEDSTGTRYTYQAVHGLVKPVDNAYVREEFEDAKHNCKLLKYYSTVDEFAWN